MDRHQGAARHRTRDPHACGQGTDRVRATQDIERYEKRTLTKRMVIDECHGDEGTIEICGCSKAAQWLISSSPRVWPSRQLSTHAQPKQAVHNPRGGGDTSVRPDRLASEKRKHE